MAGGTGRDSDGEGLLALVDDPVREARVLEEACHLVEGDDRRLDVLLTRPRLLDSLVWMSGPSPEALESEAQLARRRQICDALARRGVEGGFDVLPIARRPRAEEVDALLTGHAGFVLASTMNLPCARSLMQAASASGVAVHRIDPGPAPG